MKLSDEGLAMIQAFEGTVLHVYPDQRSIPTVCTGHVVKPDDASWIADGVTRDECRAVLREDVARYERCVTDFVHVPLEQAQFDCLVSLCFNIGETAFARSTLVRVLNQGDYVGAARRFLDWKWAGGKPILLDRRIKEATRFLDAIPIDSARIAAEQDELARAMVSDVVDPDGASAAGPNKET